MSNPIDAMKERLDGGRLWQKGAMGDWDLPNEPVCLIGSWCAVTGRQNDDLPQEVRSVIAEQYPDRTLDGDVWVDEFNDDVRTVWRDVEVVLEKASLLYDETHAVSA